MNRIFIAGLVTLVMTGCAQSVRVLNPPTGNPPAVQSQPVMFTVEFHSRADVSTFRATIDPPSGPSMTPIDITGSFSPPPAPGAQSTAVVSVPQNNCSVLVSGCIDERALSVAARMNPRQAFDRVGHTHRFRINGVATPPPPPPPPAPGVRLTAANTEATAHWGSSATYGVSAEKRNGLSGNVQVAAQNLPTGATSSPLTLTFPGGTTDSGTVTVNTAAGATALGAHSLRLEATGTNASDRVTATLRVLPGAGAFTSLNWRTASSSCTGSGITVQANVLGTVSFQGPGINTTGIPVVWYAFTPNCRGAVVIGPSAGVNAGFPANVFNFGFPASIANSPGSHRSLSLQAWDQTHFRAAMDGSMLIATSVNASGRQASLWNMLSLGQISPPHSYNIAATLNASITGTQVQVTPTVGNAFSWNLP